MSSKTTQQIEFILKEFVLLRRGMDHRGLYKSGSMETALGGDDAADRIARFAEQFPGRTPPADGIITDRHLQNAYVRFCRLLNRLVDIGVVHKNRTGVHKDYVGDAYGWVHIYWLDEMLLNLLLGNSTLGKSQTPAEMAVSLAEQLKHQ